MWAEIVALFSAMEWPIIVCLLVGLAFVIIEMFLPGFGFFGGVGAVLLIVGIIMQISNTSSGSPLVQFFLLLFLLLAILTAAFFTMLHSIKHGRLKNNVLFRNDTAVPEGLTEGTVNYSDLVGKMGIALTALRPSGVIAIENVEYDVVAAGFFIDKGDAVVVVNVEGNRVVVKKYTE